MSKSTLSVYNFTLNLYCFLFRPWMTLNRHSTSEQWFTWRLMSTYLSALLVQI